MEDCEFLSGCPIFKKYEHEWLPKDWIIGGYCKGRHDKCQRKQMRAKGEIPPINMLPNGSLLDPNE